MAYEVLLDPSVVERADEIVDYLSCVLASPSAATTFLDGLDELVGRYVVLLRVEDSLKGSGVVYVTNILHDSNYQDLL